MDGAAVGAAEMAACGGPPLEAVDDKLLRRGAAGPPPPLPSLLELDWKNIFKYKYTV